MIAGKSHCSLQECWERTLALCVPPATTDPTEKNRSPEGSVCVDLLANRAHAKHCEDAQKHFQGMTYRGVLNSSKESGIVAKTEHRCSDTARVCISMGHIFLHKTHASAYRTKNVALQKNINKTFKGNSCWISQECYDALIVAHRNRN